MNTRRKDNIFTLLRENGPFATNDAAPLATPAFSKSAKTWVKTLHEEGVVTIYRIIRNHIFDFLDVCSFAEIQMLIDNEQRRRHVEKRAYSLLGNMFGIEGNEREVVSKVKSYSQTADGVIRYLRNKVLANFAPYIEITNEIDATNSPAELLLILFDDRYHKKARFEAKRKLILMNLAGSIDQRERETDIETKFGQFLKFLNEYVWSSKFKIGELEHVSLVSNHAPDSFTCTSVRIIDLHSAAKLKRKAGQKLTLIKRRRFLFNGREIPIYVSVRKKSPEAKVLKLLRKGEENPAIAVDDELGLMAVVDSVKEVNIFQKHLTQRAIKADSLMTLEEVSDTLSGNKHMSHNLGSSPKTPMLKFFAKMGGMRVEFIVHTNKTYLNYIYQRDVSHDEYEVRRIFDSGVVELLFPKDIYHLDLTEKKDQLISWFRKRIEDT